MTSMPGFVPSVLYVTTASIAYPTFATGTSAVPLDTESLSLLVLLPVPEEQSSTGHHLKSILLIQLRTSESGALAITYLDTEEYGWGKTEGEAIADLMTSLVEYMESLEARQDQLGDPAAADLKKLHALFT